jgi:hypothetical protein
VPYLELIKEAFGIVRHHRYLWFYGVFAGGASVNFPSRFPAGSSDGSSGGSTSVDPGVVIAILAVVLILALVFIALSVISQGALADSVAATRSGEHGSFGTAWRFGLRSFWRVLGLLFLTGLAAIVVLLAVVIPVASVIILAVSTHNTAVIVVTSIAAALPALLILIALFIFIGVTIQLSLRHLVLARARIFESVAAGWRLVRDNLLPSGAMLLIQYAANFVGSILISLVVLLLSLPAIILLIAGVKTAGIVAAVLAGLIVIPAGLTAYGALGAFNHSLWTLAYLELSRPLHLDTKPG